MRRANEEREDRRHQSPERPSHFHTARACSGVSSWRSRKSTRREPQETDRDSLSAASATSWRSSITMIPRDPAKSVAGMRKLAEMYKVPVVLGPFGTPQVWACSGGQRGAQGPFQRSFDVRRIAQERATPSTSRSACPGSITGIPWPRRVSRKDTRRPPCSPTSMRPIMSWGKRFGQKLESLGGQVVAVRKRGHQEHDRLPLDHDQLQGEESRISYSSRPTKSLRRWPSTTRSTSDTKASSSSPLTVGSRRKRSSVSTGSRAHWSRRCCTHSTESIPIRTREDMRPPLSRSTWRRTRKISRSPVSRYMIPLGCSLGQWKSRGSVTDAIRDPRSLPQGPAGRQAAAHLSQHRRVEERTDGGRARVDPGSEGRPV